MIVGDLTPSRYARQPVYGYLRGQGLGRVEIEGLFVARNNSLPDIAQIEAKLALLRDLGFENPVKMIVSLPAILGLARENIEAKLALLRDLGFENPVKMIVSSPAILGLARENIEAKLALLRDLGFENPVKMIVSLPAILGYARENIEFKVLVCHALRAPGAKLFMAIISRSPIPVAVAASDPGVRSLSAFREAWTIRKRQARTELLALLLRRRAHPMVQAYHRYRPAPSPIRSAA
jgi:hypothetical protein